MRCVLIGNFGVGNFGDEALREYFLGAFPEVEWSVVSSLSSLPRLPLGLRSLFTPWLRTIWAFYRADAVVFGGGSLFTDSESPFACFLWGWHAFIAWILQKPIVLAFQGIGPFRTRRGEWIAKWVCRKAVFISVRDTYSYNRVNRWSLNTKIVQTFDPVFSLLCKENRQQSSQNVLIVIPRNNSGATLREYMKNALARDRFDSISILLLQPDDEAEVSYVQTLQTELPIPTTTISIRSIDAMIESLYDARVVLSERYHGALAALALGIPVEVIAQAEGDKLDALKGYIKKDPAELRVLVDAGERALHAILRS